MPGRIAVAREMANLFKVVAHPDRLRLVEEIGEGEQDVSSLAATLALSSVRISQHLSLLRAHRIVEERRDGRHRYYRLRQPGLAQWIVAGLDFIAGGNSDVDRSKVKAVRKVWPA